MLQQISYMASMARNSSNPVLMILMTRVQETLEWQEWNSPRGRTRLGFLKKMTYNLKLKSVR